MRALKGLRRVPGPGSEFRELGFAAKSAYVPPSFTLFPSVHPNYQTNPSAFASFASSRETSPNSGRSDRIRPLKCFYETKPIIVGGTSYTSPHMFKRRCERFLQGFKPPRFYCCSRGNDQGLSELVPPILPNEPILPLCSWCLCGSTRKITKRTHFLRR
jgi:hypothetical protein